LAQRGWGLYRGEVLGQLVGRGEVAPVSGGGFFRCRGQGVDHGPRPDLGCDLKSSARGDGLEPRSARQVLEQPPGYPRAGSPQRRNRGLDHPTSRSWGFLTDHCGLGDEPLKVEPVLAGHRDCGESLLETGVGDVAAHASGRGRDAHGTGEALRLLGTTGAGIDRGFPEGVVRAEDVAHAGKAETVDGRRVHAARGREHPRATEVGVEQVPEGLLAHRDLPFDLLAARELPVATFQQW
jgi:hypothetical protein